MKRLITSIIGLVVITLLVSFVGISKVKADCQTVYGGGQVCTQGTVRVDKVIWNSKDINASNGSYVDNIDSSTMTFDPSNQIKFQIRVTNTSGSTINQITVQDILPSFLNFVSTTSGSWDSNSRTINYTINNLGAGSTDTQTIIVQAFDQNNLPKGTTCVTNQAQAFAQNGGSDSDLASFCMQNAAGPTQVLGITTMPSTGPASQGLIAMEVLGFILAGGAFLYMSRSLNR